MSNPPNPMVNGLSQSAPGSPWKKSNSHGLNSELAKKAMAAINPVHSPYVPGQLERHLEFMHFNSEGHMILGCSNLTGRFWIGSLWYYRDPNEAPSVEKALTGVDFDNGLVDGFFIDDESIVVGTDNGSVELVKMAFSQEADPQTSFFYLDRLHSVQEHDDLISGIVMNADKTKLITSSYDKSIVILDKELNLKLVTRFNDAHSDLINGLDANPLNSDIMGTAANDGLVGLWDLREGGQTSPTCILYEDLNLKPTFLRFTPDNEHYMLVGNQGGEIQLLDVRKSKHCLAKVAKLNQPISKIKFCPHDVSLFAVCCESSPMAVFSLDKEKTSIEIKYQDSRHEDFVRDIVWQPDSNSRKLFSCGWDHKVLSHTL